MKARCQLESECKRLTAPNAIGPRTDAKDEDGGGGGTVPLWWRGGLMVPGVLWACLWVGSAGANSAAGRGYGLATLPLASAPVVLHAFSMLENQLTKRLLWLHFGFISAGQCPHAYVSCV